MIFSTIKQPFFQARFAPSALVSALAASLLLLLSRDGGRRGSPRLWTSLPKHTHGQTDMGGFCRDLWPPQMASHQVRRGHAGPLKHLDQWTHPQGRGCVLVCRQGGQRSLGGMNQPLSWDSRPLTYRACFSGTQRSTLTLSLTFPIAPLRPPSFRPRTSVIRSEQGAISEPCEMLRWRSSDTASWILYISSCFPDNYRPRHAHN